MITCKFAGELGNNLFQLATLIGHAEKYKYDFCIPNHRDREKPLEISSLFDYNFNFKNIDLPQYRCNDMFMPEFERKFEYQEIPNSDNICLCGYFQSEKYFKHCKNKIINNYLKFKSEHIKYINDKYSKLFEKETVGLHFRIDVARYRSDIRQFHPFVPLEFYKNCVNQLPKNVNYLIFSDDIEWCMKNVNFLGKNTFFIDENILDLVMLTKCNYLIIANSTYSWWSAWLNNNENSIVFAPKTYWFGPALSHLNSNDLFPKEWKCV